MATNKGFIDQEAPHLFGQWAMAGYGEVGGIPVGVAGIVGVGLTLVVAGAIAYATRRRDVPAEV